MLDGNAGKKWFVLVRGDSGLLYLYEREMWGRMVKSTSKIPYSTEPVAESNDIEALRRLQSLVNKDMEVGNEWLREIFRNRLEPKVWVLDDRDV